MDLLADGIGGNLRRQLPTDAPSRSSGMTIGTTDGTDARRRAGLFHLDESDRVGYRRCNVACRWQSLSGMEASDILGADDDFVAPFVLA